MIRTVISVIVVICGSLSFTACISERDVSNENRFSSLKGATFLSLQPLVIYESVNEKGTLFLGDPKRIGFPDSGESGNGKFPVRAGAYLFHAEAPAGSRFTITKIIRHRSPESEFLVLEGVIAAPSLENPYTVRPAQLMNVSSDQAELDSNYFTPELRS